MGNYVSEFEKTNKEYEKFYQAYYDFRAKTDNKHKKVLLEQLRVLRKQESLFKVAVNNMYLGKEQ